MAEERPRGRLGRGDQHISREEEQFLMSYNTAAYLMCYEEAQEMI